MSKSFKDFPTGCGCLSEEFMHNLSSVIWCGPDLYAHTIEIHKIQWASPFFHVLGGQFFENTSVHNILESFIKFCELVLLNQLSL